MPIDCPFCLENIKDRRIAQNDSMAAIADSSPVSDHHILIIPRRHFSDYFSMTNKEHQDAQSLLETLKNYILKKDPLVTGFNIGINIGASAGQTIFHCHIHLIPRRDDDTPHPRGGVRGVIPEKMNY